MALQRAGAIVGEDEAEVACERGGLDEKRRHTVLAVSGKVKRVDMPELSAQRRGRNAWGDRVVGWGAQPVKNDKDVAVSMCMAAEAGDLKALRRLLLEGPLA